MQRQICSLQTAETHQSRNCQNYFNNSVKEENAQSRFACIKAVPPTTPVLCLETRPFQSGGRCHTSDLVQSMPLRISPFSLALQVLCKVIYDQTVNTCLLHQHGSHTPPSTRNNYGQSTAASKEHKLKNPTRESSSSNCKQNIATSGVDHISERLLKKGVSETAVQLVTITRRTSSESNTICSEEYGLAGMINNRLIHFDFM